MEWGQACGVTKIGHHSWEGGGGVNRVSPGIFNNSGGVKSK